MLRPSRSLTIAPLAALALAACGTSDEQQVRDALDRFERAVASKDYQQLCDELLAGELVGQLRSVGLPCEVALRTGLEGVNRPRLEVRRVKVRGDEALAVVRSTAKGQPSSTDTVKLRREDGSWRVASLSGPQPPAPSR